MSGVTYAIPTPIAIKGMAFSEKGHSSDYIVLVQFTLIVGATAYHTGSVTGYRPNHTHKSNRSDLYGYCLSAF